MTAYTKSVGIYLRGICMGAADAVPGVSGGTIALITGIYERLISAITAVGPERVRRIAGGVTADGRSDAVDALEEIDIRFLFLLGSGIITAVILVLRFVDILLQTNPIETYGFFFGLIGASAVVLYSDISLTSPTHKAAAVSGFLVAFFSSQFAASTLQSSPPVIFIAGAVAVSAMILPGISGSLLLIILGQYEYMSSVLSRFTEAVAGAVSGDSFGPVITSGVPIATFLTGGVVGLVTVSHTVRWALDHYRQATLAFLVSLVVGALRAPVHQATLELAASGAHWSIDRIFLFVMFAICGAVVVFGIDNMAGGIELDSTPA